MFLEVISMSKTTVTRIFVGAVVAVFAGMSVALVAVLAALAGGIVTIGGPDVLRVDAGAFGGTLPWLFLALLAVAGGAIAALASWIGALLNTVRLDDKTWFVVLLVLGLFSLGWIAMGAYVLAGPDSTRTRVTGPASGRLPALG